MGSSSTRSGSGWPSNLSFLCPPCRISPMSRATPLSSPRVTQAPAVPSCAGRVAGRGPCQCLQTMTAKEAEEEAIHCCLPLPQACLAPSSSAYPAIPTQRCQEGWLRRRRWTNNGPPPGGASLSFGGPPSHTFQPNPFSWVIRVGRCGSIELVLSPLLLPLVALWSAILHHSCLCHVIRVGVMWLTPMGWPRFWEQTKNGPESLSSPCHTLEQRRERCHLRWCCCQPRRPPGLWPTEGRTKLMHTLWTHCRSKFGSAITQSEGGVSAGRSICEWSTR